MPQCDPDSQKDHPAGLLGRIQQRRARIVQYLKKGKRDGEPLPDSPSGLSASQAIGILITRPERRTEQKTLSVQRMKTADRHLGEMLSSVRGVCQTLPGERRLRQAEWR